MRPRPPRLVAVAVPIALALAGCPGRAPEPREELVRGGQELTPGAFVEAAQRGDLRSVRLYLRAGFDVDAPDALGRTPLVAAADAGSKEVAVALLDAGATLKLCTTSPAPGAFSPLFAAAVRGNVEMATLLLERGADPEQVCGETTPGNAAARFGRGGVVKLLAARGAHITHDPLREKAAELAAKVEGSADALAGSFVARGTLRRVLSREDHPAAVAKIAEKRYFLGQLLAVEVAGRSAVLATNLTRFEPPGPFTLRVLRLGPTATKRGELELLVEDVHHEASLYLHGQLCRLRDDAYVEYAASQLPAAFARVDAAGAAPDGRTRAERALLALPEVLAAELVRVEERSALSRELVPFVRELVTRKTVGRDRARLLEALRDAAAMAAGGT